MIDGNRESAAGQRDRPGHANGGARPRASRREVCDRLQQRILSGRLRGGDRLRQIELAREFGVSQSVVRESLIELQFGGLVEAVDNLGVFVKPIDPAALLSAYEIREVLEGLAARCCCEFASRHDLREMRRLADRIHELGEAGELESMGGHDRAFHQQIIRHSGNALLEQLTEGYRSLGMVVRAHRDIDTVHREHHAVVDAIEAADADLAERLAREHVRAARAALAAEVEAGDFQPAWIDQPQDPPLPDA